jgi:hypothetical protein
LALLKEQVCPQCLARGGLLVGSVLEGWKPGESTMFARWRPVLMCEGCDLHVVGEYGPGGNIAAFENLGAKDGQADSEATQEATG